MFPDILIMKKSHNNSKNFNNTFINNYFGSKTKNKTYCVQMPGNKFIIFPVTHV